MPRLLPLLALLLAVPAMAQGVLQGVPPAPPEDVRRLGALCRDHAAAPQALQALACDPGAPADPRMAMLHILGGCDVALNAAGPLGQRIAALEARRNPADATDLAGTRREAAAFAAIIDRLACLPRLAAASTGGPGVDRSSASQLCGGRVAGWRVFATRASRVVVEITLPGGMVSHRVLDTGLPAEAAARLVSDAWIERNCPEAVGAPSGPLQRAEDALRGLLRDLEVPLPLRCPGVGGPGTPCSPWTLPRPTAVGVRG
jgi:hypothetical protein